MHRWLLHQIIPRIFFRKQRPRVLHRFPRHFTHVYLDVVGVIEKEEYQSLSSREIADRCRDLILRRFEHKDARFYHLKPKAKSEEDAPKA